MIDVRAFDRRRYATLGTALQSLEAIAEYPLGNDHFRIDHGDAYFRFFERLGEPRFHVAMDGQRIVGCAAGVLRRVPRGAGTVRAWYLCDLKVHPDYRRQGIPARLFRKGLLPNYFRCGRAYAISMNPPDGENPVVRVTERLPFFPIGKLAELRFYSLDADAAAATMQAIAEIVGPCSWLSLQGTKDLILRSTGGPLRLLHLQHGPLAEPGAVRPEAGALHMVCAPEGSRLATLLDARFACSATASVIGYRVQRTGWEFVLTSDI